jgi:hypothetical protein
MRLALDILEGKTSPGKITTASDQRRAARQRRSICRRNRVPPQGVVSTTLPGAGPERMGLTLDILEGQLRPGKITTASDHVAPVHRSLPPSMRSSLLRR